MPTPKPHPAHDPQASRIGHYVTTVAFNETVRAYVPPPLPPSPPLVFSDELLNRLSEADRAVGRLDGVAMLLPDKALFLYMYVREVTGKLRGRVFAYGAFLEILDAGTGIAP
jgi:hypothetical protein